MSFSSKLIEAGKPYLDLQAKKPFLTGIAKGDLANERFLYWVKVDYPYLINFSRILALGVSKAIDLEGMRIMQDYLDWIIDEELALHESYAEKNGISKEELAHFQMGPIKYAYTRHELSTAHSGTLEELISGIMPCLVGYQIVSKALVKQYPIQDDNPYRNWLSMYSADTLLDDHTQKILNLFDKLTENSTEQQKARMYNNFITSELYETMCWDAYYDMETWPTIDRLNS
jgi:thiaminase (transcriptional activator TenA)